MTALEGYHVSRRGIMEQAKWDPILDRCLTIWRAGDMTYDEAMALAAFELSKANRKLKGELQACKDDHPHRIR